jgi:hypothetical protein
VCCDEVIAASRLKQGAVEAAVRQILARRAASLVALLRLGHDRRVSATRGSVDFQDPERSQSTVVAPVGIMTAATRGLGWGFGS